MRADVQGFYKFKVASRTDIFILQKTKKHISLKKRFGRQCFISRTAQACQTLVAILTRQTILILFILILDISYGQNKTARQVKCNAGLLNGKWTYVDSRNIFISNLDTFKLSNGSTNSASVTYLKNGKYINDQIDYKTSGKYKTNATNCTVLWFDDNNEKGDTLYFKINYIDNKNLLLYLQKDAITYYYRRQ